VLGQLNNTITNMLKLVNTNVDTLQQVSEIGNIKAKSLANAYVFEEQIRAKLRSSKKFQELRAKNIMKQELDKLKISDDDVQDNEATETNSSFDELISEFEDNIIF